MENIDYLHDYDLSHCSLVTLYDRETNSKYRLLVPDVLVLRFHLKTVVDSLDCTGVVSSNSEDDILCLLNTIRLYGELNTIKSDAKCFVNSLLDDLDLSYENK